VIRAIAVVACAAALAGCAARAPVRPTGTQTSDPTAVDAFNQATKQCASLKTVTAELRLSGRAGSERIRGTLHAGLAAPAALRFEAVAPFGPPVFILAGRGNRATLLLPRDDRVLADAAVPDVLERLTGLALAADDLRLILTGCLAEPATPAEGRAWPGGWRAVTVGAGITAYLKAIGAGPAVVAADHGAWRIDYTNHQGGWPRTVRIRSAERSPGERTAAASSSVTPAGIDITATIEQLEINAGIDEKAFVIDVPPGASPITLDHLRAIK
jgi:outer membrane lipoprotein-sorting protein